MNEWGFCAPTPFLPQPTPARLEFGDKAYELDRVEGGYAYYKLLGSHHQALNSRTVQTSENGRK